MMKVMKRYAAAALLAAATAWASGAQNLNPTVEVTNQFEGKVMEVTKPVVGMAVPDSLLRFDLEFDYSVFDTPYKGTYEFSPYLLDMKPRPDAWRGSTLYLRLGAGYAPHPTADIVYSPELSGPFQINVYGMHRSYLGKYKVRLGEYEDDWTGYDLLSRAGVDGRYDYSSGAFSFDVGYYGIHTKQDDRTSGYNAFDVKLRAQSFMDARNTFYYDVTTAFRGASDSYSAPDKLKTFDFGLDATAGPVFGDHAVLADMHVGIDTYGGLFSSRTGLVSVVPKYVWNSDRLRIAAGVRFSAVLRSEEPWMGHALAGRKGQFVYPDVRIGYEAVTDRLNLYASATGGDHVRAYAELKEDHHFYNPYFGCGEVPMTDNSVERVRFALGAQGNIASKFRYDVRLGWLYMAGGMVDAVRPVRADLAAGAPSDPAADDDADAPSGNPGRPSVTAGLMPSVAYEDYGLFFAHASFAYDGRPVAVDGGFRFGRPTTGPLEQGFAPASTGWLKLTYNKMDRILAGVRAEGALKRPAGTAWGDLHIPGYVDLGLFGEYAVTPHLSLWLRADNLLNMNIQPHPLYPCGGISFTGGIIFSL